MEKSGQSGVNDQVHPRRCRTAGPCGQNKTSDAVTSSRTPGFSAVAFEARIQALLSICAQRRHCAIQAACQ